MSNTRPPLDMTFFQTVQGRGIVLGPSLRSYMRTIFRGDPTAERLGAIRMEEFFKDLFFDFQDAPSDARFRRAYTELVDLYVRVLRETTNWLCEDRRGGGPVGWTIAAAADKSEAVTIITFNHDLVIENEIYRRSKLRRCWCLNEGYGTYGASLGSLQPGVTRPLFPLHRDGLCSHDEPIRVSIARLPNWAGRLNSDLPTAPTFSGESGPRTVYLYNGRQLQTRTIIGRGRAAAGSTRGRASWNTWPVIIPPVYAKQALEFPRFRGHLRAWSAVSGLAGRIVRHAKGIEFQEAVSAGVPA